VALSTPDPMASWMALMVTRSFLPKARANSGVVTMAQAEPSLRVPFWWLFQDTWAMARLSVSLEMPCLAR
jgi:hypothetical protein